MALRVGINGFGRIGRNIYRAAMNDDQIEIVAVNDITDTKTLAHLLKYDSILGNLEARVQVEESEIAVNDRSFRVFSERDPAKLPWKNFEIDIVVESTGLFTKKADAVKHIEAGGAKKVIISAPATGADLTVVMGVNHESYDPAKHHVLSNASCTTNCLAPVAKVVVDRFGVVNGLMTTIHSYTNDQNILDLPHKDLRRARAAALSMIPTTTGAARAVSLVIPELAGKMDGIAVRVPTPNVSLVDVTFRLEKNTTAEELNAAFKAAADGDMKGILSYTDEPLVSNDFRLNSHSSIVDLLSTNVIDGNLAKVFSWYDNEWGFSSRVIDLIKLMGRSL